MDQSRDDRAREYGTEIMAASFTPGSLEDYFRRTGRGGLSIKGRPGDGALPVHLDLQLPLGGN
jgi:hypothetical protein